VAEALDPFLGGPLARLKWPNDLLVGGRKLGGILCEGSWEAGGAGFVIVGVGLNVLHAACDFPEGIRAGATSIALAAGVAPRRRAVAGSVIPAVLAALPGPAELEADFLARLAARDALRGREVEVTDPATGERLARGTAAGIAADGSLRLLPSDGGPPRSIRSGTVRAVTEGFQPVQPR
jgi:BirA family biotin operon repressor/biotin-[acetyl-CoA-carboxylase] ligase